MSYQYYVIAAYMVFVVVLLWDFVATRVRIAQLLRAAKLRGKRLAVVDGAAQLPPEPLP